MSIFTDLFDENVQIYQMFKNLKATFLKTKLIKKTNGLFTTFGFLLPMIKTKQTKTILWTQ